MDRVRMVKKIPAVKTASTAWETDFFAAASSLAPQALAMKDKKPTPNAEMLLPISQFTVLVAPTAAVAWVPRVPTMAVSSHDYGNHFHIQLLCSIFFPLHDRLYSKK